MIARIHLRHFKGISADQEIGPYNLFVGRNGAGKSARTQALTIAILGYIPGESKQPGAIFTTYASGPEMIVAFETDQGQRFARKFRQGEDGEAKQILSLNGKAITQHQLDRALLDMGNPRVFDLRAFTELSEQKKIEALLDLSPPSKDLQRVTQGIAESEERINRLRSDARAKKMVVEQLTGERASLQLPSGTLAEIQAEIAEKQKALMEAQAELTAAQVAEQKRRDEEAAKEREKRAAEEAARREEKAREEGKAQGRAEVKKEIPPAAKLPPPLYTPPFDHYLDILLRVKQALEETGCEI